MLEWYHLIFYTPQKTSKITFSGFRKFLRKDSFKFVFFYISDLKKLSKLTKNGLNFKYLPSSTNVLKTSFSDEHFLKEKFFVKKI